MGPVITLTTDFGTSDGYVASMKGAILKINPQAIIVDLTHDISPQNVAEGAFVFGTAYHYFPRGAIHVAVVDPGVGTRRRAVLLVTPLASFIAPDNGLLSYVFQREWGRAGRVRTPGKRRVLPGARAFQIQNPRLWLHPVSPTFQGRDVFAPVAAHLSLGLDPQEVGRPLAMLRSLPLPIPQREGGALLGEVLHIDRFGNLVTNFREDEVPRKPVTKIGVRTIHGLSLTYARGGEVMALIGSHSYLEIACRNGSAAELLGVRVGDSVRLESASGR